MKQIKKRTPIYFRVHLILGIIVIATMVRQFFLENLEGVLMCLLTLLLFMIPQTIEKRSSIILPTTLEVIILLFIFSAEILGEIHNFYGTFKYWDLILHVLNGFLATAIGFSLIDILNREDRFYIKMSPVFVTLFAFCFSMTIGVLWEFFEFGVDVFFNMDMQKDTIIHKIVSVKLNPEHVNNPVIWDHIKSVKVMMAGSHHYHEINGYLDIGLLDTMKDLMVNFVGAVIFGILYLKNRDKYHFAGRFIPKFNEPEEKHRKIDE
ncbi:hypothetical protein ABTQ33_10915 [Paucilactobacillus suebicus]|uniref:Uncharacterized protein n=1 Tax=Paucilactobacillus suebicus DSM 5007 = KCTC 3549 TaxID=1423807 RepID=A0A0R1W2T5_9LACO|nr:hypothetical protein [Paucilactobacillus suebicus]KRM11917.1 hypothetical protein FD16_GL000459 [Paucilactobacillus suebicus DSM 5007 = KCTC 3549]